MPMLEDEVANFGFPYVPINHVAVFMQYFGNGRGPATTPYNTYSLLLLLLRHSNYDYNSLSIKPLLIAPAL
jgi:hypothetical protein